MPEGVRTDLLVNSRLSHVLADDAIDAARGEPPATKVPEERLAPRCMPRGALSACRPTRWFTSGPGAVLEHPANGFGRGTVERHQPFLAALSSYSRNAAREIHVAEIEIHENTMALANGIRLPDTSPHVLYSPGVDVVCWTPQGAVPP